jgi:hypothetical protein
MHLCLSGKAPKRPEETPEGLQHRLGRNLQQEELVPSRYHYPMDLPTTEAEQQELQQRTRRLRQSKRKGRNASCVILDKRRLFCWKWERMDDLIDKRMNERSETSRLNRSGGRKTGWIKQIKQC